MKKFKKYLSENEGGKIDIDALMKVLVDISVDMVKGVGQFV